MRNLIFIGCGLSGFLFLLLGLFLPSIRVTFHGLVSLAVPDPRVYSLFTLGTSLPSTGGVDSPVWNLSVVTSDYLLFTFIFPLLHGFSLFILAALHLWITYVTPNNGSPGSKEKLIGWRYNCFAFAEICNLFSCLDVVTALYFLLLPQIHKFALYIIAIHCGALNRLLEIPLLSDWLDGYPTCFALDGEILYGFFFLIASCVLMRVAHYEAHLIFCRVLRRKEWREGEGKGEKGFDSVLN